MEVEVEFEVSRRLWGGGAVLVSICCVEVGFYVVELYAEF